MHRCTKIEQYQFSFALPLPWTVAHRLVHRFCGLLEFDSQAFPFRTILVPSIYRANRARDQRSTVRLQGFTNSMCFSQSGLSREFSCCGVRAIVIDSASESMKPRVSRTAVVRSANRFPVVGALTAKGAYEHPVSSLMPIPALWIAVRKFTCPAGLCLLVNAYDVVCFKFVGYRAIAQAGHHGRHRVALFYKIFCADRVIEALANSKVAKSDTAE